MHYKRGFCNVYSADKCDAIWKFPSDTDNKSERRMRIVMLRFPARCIPLVTDVNEATSGL